MNLLRIIQHHVKLYKTLQMMNISRGARACSIAFALISLLWRNNKKLLK